MMFFFFQAEDGIRDLVRSRGLGDVYKRQCRTSAGHEQTDDREPDRLATCIRSIRVLRELYPPVSYTHLTLPTSDLV